MFNSVRKQTKSLVKEEETYKKLNKNKIPANN